MKRNVAVTLLAVCVLTTAVAQDAFGQSSPRPANLGEATAKAVPPFKIFDNLYSVGLDFVNAYVIQTSGGLILVDTLFGQYRGSHREGVAAARAQPQGRQIHSHHPRPRRSLWRAEDDAGDDRREGDDGGSRLEVDGRHHQERGRSRGRQQARRARHGRQGRRHAQARKHDDPAVSHARSYAGTSRLSCFR